jgi:hypothetical protein
MDFHEFSLIYPSEESRQRHTSGASLPDIDTFTLEELGLAEIFTLKTGDLPSFFTTEAEVIQYRLATFDDMMRCPELTEMLNRLVPVLNDIMELRRLEADNGDPNDYLLLSHNILYTNVCTLRSLHFQRFRQEEHFRYHQRYKVQDNRCFYH